MLDKNLHRKVMFELLRDIYEEPKLSSILGFKGGTALYFLYGLNRFSVDLDFDLLDASKLEEVYDLVCKIASKYGQLKDHAIKHFGCMIVVSYKAGWRQLKIDISRREFPNSYELKNYLGLMVNMMKIEDIFANKLVALTNRKELAPRDIFDLYFLAKSDFAINEEAIKCRTGGSLAEQLDLAIACIEKSNPKQYLAALGELLDSKQQHWVREKMQAETLTALKFRRSVC